jgi:hypothetical protein
MSYYSKKVSWGPILQSLFTLGHAKVERLLLAGTYSQSDKGEPKPHVIL